MRAPRRGLEQLDLLRHQQRTKLRSEALYEILVRIECRPMCAPVGVVLKLPQMDKLIDCAGIGLEVPDKFLVLASFLERREAEFLIELHGLRHCADTERVSPQFVEGHQKSPQQSGSAATRANMRKSWNLPLNRAFCRSVPSYWKPAFASTRSEAALPGNVQASIRLSPNPR